MRWVWRWPFPINVAKWAGWVVRHPIRALERLLTLRVGPFVVGIKRLGITLGIFGISFGRGGIAGFIRIPFVKIFFGGGRGGKGIFGKLFGGGKRGGGESGGESSSGGGSSGGGGGRGGGSGSGESNGSAAGRERTDGGVSVAESSHNGGKGENHVGRGTPRGGGGSRRKRGSKRETAKSDHASRDRVGDHTLLDPRRRAIENRDTREGSTKQRTKARNDRKRRPAGRRPNALGRVQKTIEKLDERRDNWRKSRDEAKQIQADLRRERKQTFRDGPNRKTRQSSPTDARRAGDLEEHQPRNQRIQGSTPNTQDGRRDFGRQSPPQGSRRRGDSRKNANSPTPLGVAGAESRNRTKAQQFGVKFSSPELIRDQESGVINFDIKHPLPRGRFLIEASAGTGKTFNLTSLVARYVAEDGLSIDSLLMVTFTNAAAEEMAERTRAKLVKALRELDQYDGSSEIDDWLVPIVSCSPEEATKRKERLKDAITNIDGASITTIHSFCQKTLRDIGLRAGDVGISQLAESDRQLTEQTIRDIAISLLGRDPDFLSYDKNKKAPDAVEKDLLLVTRSVVSNPSAERLPNENDANQSAANWRRAIERITSSLKEMRSRSGVLNFDDLISEMVRVVEDPVVGPVVRAKLCEKFKLVMIDEFQDTDSQQWKIFDKTFFPSGVAADSSVLAMIMVGDPKQAIYRFRGADIAAYLKAGRTGDLERRQIKTNFRTDPGLVGALNGLMRGFPFGNSEITYVQVDPDIRKMESALVGAGNPLQIRWLPNHAELLSDAGNLVQEAAQPLIAVDLANHVVRLLSEGRILTSRSGNGSSRQVRPSDICVLVRNHSQAEPVLAELRSRGIAVVQTRVSSVLISEAADQLRTLLYSISRFSSSAASSAVSSTFFVESSWIGISDDEKTSLQEQGAHWSESLAREGIYGFFQELKHDPRVLLSIAASGDLDRKLTDLEHLVEILHRETSGRPTTASGYLIKLDQLISVESESEELKRRTETDAEAVQIGSIHSSKGLQYPVVLVPFATQPKNQKPFVFSFDEHRFVDVAVGHKWNSEFLDYPTREALSKEEIRGDDLRLLYVALTRAEHQLGVWWSKAANGSSSSLAQILFRDQKDGFPSVSKMTDEDIRRTLTDLVASLGNSDFRELPLHIPAQPFSQKGSSETLELDRSRLTRREVIRPGWRRWSYSTIKEVAFKLGDGEYRGGSDETDRHRDEYQVSAREMEVQLGKLAGLPQGPAFGKYVHEIFENVDFAATDLEGELRRSISLQPASRFANCAIDDLVFGLMDAICTPIDEIAPGYCLRDIKKADKLAEMTFHWNLNGRGQSLLGDICSIAASDESVTFADYFCELRAKARGFRTDGLITGSIDGLYRLSGSWGERFVIVDYKSNALHAGVSDPEKLRNSYGYASMMVEMMRHDYPLQALVYGVALHRFLASRYRDYSPEKHLGGSGYLFIRGMAGRDTPLVDGVRDGVFVWRPSAATIVEVSEVFDGL